MPLGERVSEPGFEVVLEGWWRRRESNPIPPISRNGGDGRLSWSTRRRARAGVPTSPPQSWHTVYIGADGKILEVDRSVSPKTAGAAASFLLGSLGEPDEEVREANGSQQVAGRGSEEHVPGADREGQDRQEQDHSVTPIRISLVRRNQGMKGGS